MSQNTQNNFTSMEKLVLFVSENQNLEKNIQDEQDVPIVVELWCWETMPSENQLQCKFDKNNCNCITCEHNYNKLY